jgi:hypothetical protein
LYLGSGDTYHELELESQVGQTLKGFQEEKQKRILASNPSYLGGKEFQRPYHEKKITKKGLVYWLK